MAAKAHKPGHSASGEWLQQAGGFLELEHEKSLASGWRGFL
jgi:hypothetical protein